MSWPFICKTRALCHCLLHTTLKILAYNFLTRGNRKFDTFSFGSENQHGTKKGNWHERYPRNSGKSLIYLSFCIYSVIELILSTYIRFGVFNRGGAINFKLVVSKQIPYLFTLVFSIWLGTKWYNTTRTWVGLLWFKKSHEFFISCIVNKIDF